MSTNSNDLEKLSALERALSLERLHGYKTAAGDLRAAIELYDWNTRISQSLYGPLQTLEVSMRNSVNRELCGKYGENWFRNSKPTIFIDKQADKIEKVISRFDKPRPISVSDVVADLSFSFWSDLINHQMYNELWNQVVHKAFPHRPKGTKRSTAAVPVKRLNTLRNRIAHHEPIWNRDLEKDYNLTIELTRWVCPITSSWTEQNNAFVATFAHRPVLL